MTERARFDGWASWSTTRACRSTASSLARTCGSRPVGDDGERLHDWAFKDPAGLELIQREVETLGAVICGRRTYDMSIPHWGAEGPTGEARVPLFVLSHGVPDDVPEGGVYTFVDGLEEALALAREAAATRTSP